MSLERLPRVVGHHSDLRHTAQTLFNTGPAYEKTYHAFGLIGYWVLGISNQ